MASQSSALSHSDNIANNLENKFVIIIDLSRDIWNTLRMVLVLKIQDSKRPTQLSMLEHTLALVMSHAATPKRHHSY